MLRVLFVLLAYATGVNSIRAQVTLNEISATNADGILDVDFGNFSPWVELYNDSEYPIDISDFRLSYSAESVWWNVPSGTIMGGHSHLIIWCDELDTALHTSFDLSSRGGTLTLMDRSSLVIDQLVYREHPTNFSYARTQDGAGVWVLTDQPTPGQSNIASPKANQIRRPFFSLESGRYAGPQRVEIGHIQDGVAIRYTTDGSEPDILSLQYSEPFNVSKTTVIKAKAYHNQYLASETEVVTYLVDEHDTDLNVVSISTNPEYLFDNQIGIYVDGSNGVVGNCKFDVPVNWNRDWSRHARFQYFSSSGRKLVDQDVDIKVGGGCSRNFPQKTLRISPKRKYGSNELKYPFFSDKPQISSYSELNLRNSGNDFNQLMFRDALFQSLMIGKADVDYLAYEPTVVYINGRYWGIQNLRERHDEDYVHDNYGIAKANVDVVTRAITNFQPRVEGDLNSFIEYEDKLETMDLNSTAAFQFIDDHIDVEEYINYLIVNIYVANHDWPSNNQTFWRRRSPLGKYRWVLWDLDFGFASTGPNDPTLDFATAGNGPWISSSDPNWPYWPNPPSATRHIRLVLSNPEFRSRFIKALVTATNTIFHPDNLNKVIDRFAHRIKKEMPYHKQRWGGSLGEWGQSIQTFKSFGEQRHLFMKEYIKTFFGQQHSSSLVATASPAQGGEFFLNGIGADDLTHGIYFNGLHYEITQVPNPGWQFAGWKITRSSATIVTNNDGESWKYFDRGFVPALNWFLRQYDDSGWAEGKAPLGRGYGNEATTINLGSDTSDQFTTTFFRKNFTLEEVSNIIDLRVGVTYSDGIVVYLNGIEVFRNNLPGGDVLFSTTALSRADPGNKLSEFIINKSLVRDGVNTWAVEIHLATDQRDKIIFDLRAFANYSVLSNELTSNENAVSGYAFGDVTLVANYVPLPVPEGLVLNEIGTENPLVTDDYGEEESWIELYNTSNGSADLSRVFVAQNGDLKNGSPLEAASQSQLLPPDAYVLLWADNQPDQGPLHLPFELDDHTTGIVLYSITAGDTVILSEAEFRNLSPGYALSRLPNGEGDFSFVIHATPGSQNVEDDLNWIYPNPARDQIKIIAPCSNANLTILDVLGATIVSIRLEQVRIVDIDVRRFNDGIYLIKCACTSSEKVGRLIVR